MLQTVYADETTDATLLSECMRHYWQLTAAHYGSAQDLTNDQSSQIVKKLAPYYDAIDSRPYGSGPIDSCIPCSRHRYHLWRLEQLNPLPSHHNCHERVYFSCGFLAAVSHAVILCALRSESSGALRDIGHRQYSHIFERAFSCSGLITYIRSSSQDGEATPTYTGRETIRVFSRARSFSFLYTHLRRDVSTTCMRLHTNRRGHA
jgi:hypothetical protein